MFWQNMDKLKTTLHMWLGEGESLEWHKAGLKYCKLGMDPNTYIEYVIFYTVFEGLPILNNAWLVVLKKREGLWKIKKFTLQINRKLDCASYNTLSETELSAGIYPNLWEGI